MKKTTALFLMLMMIGLISISARAQRSRIAKISPPKNFQPLRFDRSPALQTLLNRAVAETIEKHPTKKLAVEDIAATLIDLRDVKQIKTATVRGDAPIYPASVVKLFYLAAAHQWNETGGIKTFTPEMQRGLKDMIVDSSNEATQYILDVLTDTSSGSELSPKELDQFGYKRNAVNRYYESLGFSGINVNQKTFCEDAYGRERQFRFDGTNRNMLTTDATARLLTEIVVGKAVSVERSQSMLDLLKRDFSGTPAGKDDQAHGFTAIALKNLNLNRAKLWSKAGWTSKTRHDAAYIETPDGLKFVLVIFTENFANERDIIPNIAEIILKEIGDIK